MNWKTDIQGFKSFLLLEKSLSINTVEGYLKDLDKFLQFLENKKYELSPKDIEPRHLKEFLKWVNESKISAGTQARIITGIKSFFSYLLMEGNLKKDPTVSIERPRIGRKLPDILSIEDINRIIDAVDMNTPEGQRNKAMLETLYSCGLRVSELVNLKISQLFFQDGFVKIIGKGNKERFIPIGSAAIDCINAYKKGRRCQTEILKGHEDILFLNRRGAKLTGVMINTIIKQLVARSRIKKRVSPHIFRHSFASHLIEGGADLRAVQEMLGHESITTTEIYTHLDRKHLRSEVLRFHPRG